MLGSVYHNGGRVVVLLVGGHIYLMLLDILLVAKGGLKVKEVATIEAVIQGFSLVLITWQEMIGLRHWMILLLLLYVNYSLFMFFPFKILGYINLTSIVVLLVVSIGRLSYITAIILNRLTRR
jgi:hypothetical protein